MLTLNKLTRFPYLKTVKAKAKDASGKTRSSTRTRGPRVIVILNQRLSRTIVTQLSLVVYVQDVMSQLTTKP